MSNFIGNNLLVVDGLNLSFRWKHDRYSISKNEYNELTYEDALEFLREDRSADYFMEELKDTILSIAASSKGQETRITISCLLAIRKLLTSMAKQPINLLVLDEVLGGVS